MTSSIPPPIECDQLHAGITVNNLTAAIDFYVSKLGFRKGFTWGEPPTFAGMNLGNVQIFFSEGTPTPSADTAAAYFLVSDADQLYEFHRANGVRIVEPIDDRAYSIRDYTVQDMDGYYLVFGHHLHTAGEPVKIKRVEISMRLEKRLAALLEDLAKHKRMTLGNCVEEILLHTNDGAGPHTKTTLRHIEELKNKHGIDYDTHASYRFVEE
jgi:catechol 2,3-dioxygenase-like lactoylglutathione lyase family enzyme